MELPSFADVVNAKKMTPEERRKDVSKLMEWSGLESSVKLIGNPYIQSYMTEYMGKTRFDNKPSLKEVLDDPKLSLALYNRTHTKERLEVNMPQAYSRHSPVCFLKPSIAKYIYKKFEATKVLDFTAGWGGRMLGAYACGIEYIGIDTNTELQLPYVKMMKELNEWTTGKATMIWDDCRNVDFSKLDYDFVFTSPPYYNKEVYEHMKPFENKKQFYEGFMIPMIEKSLKYIKNNGWVCININPEYYDELLKYGFRKADKIEEFQQSTVKRKDGTYKMEQIYCWCNNYEPEEETESQVETKTLSCIECTRCQELEKEIERLKSAMKMLLN